MSEPTLKDVKAKGYFEDEVKHFTLTFDGEQFDARRKGQKYECEGVVATLKKHKENILAGLYFGDGEPAPGLVEAKELHDALIDDSGDMWDCIDPCALLCHILLQDSAPDVQMRGKIFETLDHLGWLDETSKEIDHGRVEREFKRFGVGDEPQSHESDENPEIV